jgi:hypothetical protein
MYAPTTLAPPRDFCTLRYTTVLDDGAIVVSAAPRLPAVQTLLECILAIATFGGVCNIFCISSNA